jgi:hypothetical protein
MLPGVDIASLPDFNKGDLLAVCVPGNPAPIAVGAALINSMTAKGQVGRSAATNWEGGRGTLTQISCRCTIVLACRHAHHDHSGIAHYERAPALRKRAFAQ